MDIWSGYRAADSADEHRPKELRDEVDDEADHAIDEVLTEI